MPPSSPRTQSKRPGDFTGVQGQRLAAERDAAKKAQDVEVAETAAEEKARKASTVIDYTGQQTPEEVEVEVQEVEVKNPTRKIRVNTEVKEMTFGKEIVRDAVFDENGVMTVAPVLGNLRRYDFEPGVWYVVPADVAEHLERINYLYD